MVYAKVLKTFGHYDLVGSSPTWCTNSEIVQLVESFLGKEAVMGSNPILRSKMPVCSDVVMESVS